MYPHVSDAPTLRDISNCNRDDLLMNGISTNEDDLP
jgi:hypothetical protein